MNVDAAAAEHPRQLGNLDANLDFLARCGVLIDGVRMLEIGSGTGTMLHELRRRGFDVTGVEIRQDFIDQARRWYGDLPLTHVDGPLLPFPDGSFDVVMSFDVFEHIPDSDLHLREVARALRPGGSYVLQTPNRWTNTLFETVRWRSFTRWRSDHCSLHSLSELQQRLTTHGFTSIQAYDVPVVNAYFRRKVRRYAGVAGAAALMLLNPDRLPRACRTNLFVKATRPDAPA